MYTMNATEYNEKVMNGFFRKVYPVVARQILDTTGITQGKCIDLGGGPGMLGISLASITQLKVINYDPIAECIPLVNENSRIHGVSHRVTALSGQAEAMQFADNSIDLVISRGSIFFWENQTQGLREVYRILRPGGWAYIGGGFGTLQLLNEINALRAADTLWNEKRKERMKKNPPEHYIQLLRDLRIEGTVSYSEEGTWIKFVKPITPLP